MKKRILSVLLVCCMLASMAACSGGGDSSGSSSSAPSNSTASQSEAESSRTNAGDDDGILNPIGELPIVKEGNELTLSMFIGGLDNFVTSYDYADNAFTKRVVDETGIQMEFVAVSDADKVEKLNVLLNSDDYPDLIRGSINRADMAYYGQQGIIIPLDEYDFLSYPNIKAAFDQYPALLDIVATADGTTYALPDVNECLHCIYSRGRSWYYMPFIRDNDLKVPETTEELKEYLIYVRDNDLNGNGKQDEVPIAFNSGETDNFITCIAKYFLPFCANDDYWGLALEDGKVIEQYRSDEFRDALRYMHDLYAEGLILKDSFSMTDDQLRALGESPDGPTIAVSYTSWSNGCVKKGGESKRWYEYFILPPVEGPNGARYSGDRGPWSILSPGMYITSKCENPQAAVALYDYLLNFDVMLDGYIGPKGVCWDDGDEGVKSLQGGDALYKLLVTYGTQEENLGWNQANPMIRNNDFRLGEQANDYDTVAEWLHIGNPDLLDSMTTNDSFNEIMNYLTTVEGSMPYAISVDMFLPPLVLDDLGNERIADIKATFTPYREKTCVEFITGERDIETDWDTFLSELDGIGTPEMVEIYQNAYDAKK